MNADNPLTVFADLGTVRPGAIYGIEEFDDADHDCDMFIETAVLGGFALFVAVLCYGLWVLL